MRKVLSTLLILVLGLPLLSIGYLYLTDSVVAARFVGMFTAEADDFSVLTPRMSVSTHSHFELPVAASDELSIRPEALAQMRDYATDHKSFSLIVVHKGVIQEEWYAEGWDRSRYAQSQSMHKSVLPILVQAAIEDGLIKSLDDSVGQYILEWQDDPRGSITIENFLVMATGLRSQPFSVNPFSEDFLWLFGSNVTPILLRTPMASDPGRHWDYNNRAAEILGLVIERATNRSYADNLAENLWDPIGARGAEVWMDSDGGKGHSNCCLLAPPMDWAKFGLMLLNRGTANGNQIVSANFIDRMTSPAPLSPWYGYQIWIGDNQGSNPWSDLTRGYQRSEPFARDDVFFASGYGAQRVYVVPSEELVIVRMGPATGRAPVRADWDNAFLVNSAVRNLIE